MRARGACVALVVLAIAACTRRETAPAIAKDPTPADAIADVTPPPKPAQVTVTAAVLCMAGTCSALLSVRNDGDVAISLDDELVAEVAGDGGFTRVHEQYVTIGQCDEEVSKYGPHPGRPCRSLGPHETLGTAPWRGFTCSSQCVWTCRANAMHPKGTYRFVVHECGGAARAFTSETFEWPAW